MTSSSSFGGGSMLARSCSVREGLAGELRRIGTSERDTYIESVGLASWF
jgi:hypothetical protein